MVFIGSLDSRMNLFLIIFVEKKLDGDKRGAKGLGVCVCMEGRESIGQCV